YERQRRRETVATAPLVPVELQIEVVSETPARRGVAWGEKAAHSAPGEEVDPAIPGGRDIDERSDAAQQQFAVGEFGAGGTCLIVRRGKRLRALVEPGHVHIAQAMLLAPRDRAARAPDANGCRSARAR